MINQSCKNMVHLSFMWTMFLLLSKYGSFALSIIGDIWKDKVDNINLTVIYDRSSSYR